MKKYILEWANGSKSAMELTKDQIIIAVNNWLDKNEGWNYIIVKNVKTGKAEIIEEDYYKNHHITDITV